MATIGERATGLRDWMTSRRPPVNRGELGVHGGTGHTPQVPNRDSAKPEVAAQAQRFQTTGLQGPMNLIRATPMTLLVRDRPNDRLTFQYNPSSIKSSSEAKYKMAEVHGVPGIYPEYLTTSGRTIEVELFLNEWGNLAEKHGYLSVEDQIAWLEGKMWPSEEVNGASGGVAFGKKPPILYFIWHEVFACVLVSVSVDRTMFRNSGMVRDMQARALSGKPDDPLGATIEAAPLQAIRATASIKLVEFFDQGALHKSEENRSTSGSGEASPMTGTAAAMDSL